MRILAFTIGILSLATSAFGQRYYFAYAADNPFTLAVEQPGQEIEGTFRIPRAPLTGETNFDSTFKVQVWFQNGPSARWNFSQFPTFIGYDRSWTDAFSAAPIDRKISSNIETRLSNPGRISRGTGPGTKALIFLGNATRGGNSPGSGTNTTLTGGARPWGITTSIYPAIEGSGLAAYGNLGANERVRLYDLTLRNEKIATGDIYGDVPGENGLIAYNTGIRPITKSGSSTFWTPGTARYANGARIALQAFAPGSSAP